MLKNNILIRIATPEDAGNLLKIYSYYVENTAVSFETKTPSINEFRERITNTLKRYPYLVAENSGKIIGYAYASHFKQRAAYDWAVETTVYVEKSFKRCGVGTDLYNALEKILSLQNILNMNACIAYTEMQTEFLTTDSYEFHKHVGFKLVGEFHKCGYKFNNWYNMVWMEKLIGEHTANQAVIKTFDQVREYVKERYHYV